MDDSSSKKLSPLKQAYLALEKMQARLDEMESAKTEPIAIIGIGCRFPGGVNDLQSFWRILRGGVDAIVEIPPDRWNADAFYDPNQQTPGKMCSKQGGFIENIDEFDPQFFGIAPREAMEMDPQQRMMLDVTWEALENAGQAPDRLSGSQTAVFSAVATYEYSDLKMGTADLTNFDNYYLSGVGPNMLSGRLSYFLGLHGPSVTVDTACSSSLTAIHLACQSLRLGECQMAITGGANAIIQPHIMVAYSRAGLLAKDGRCKSFDASADGLTRGEGCGVLILKRLSDALAAGDHIHAIIRGSAVNQDGPSSGLSAPNGPAQTAVIREALRRGMVDPLSVGYVEAHGTGTSLGDPIEVQALGEALCKKRSKDKPLYIGSVKTNFGHLEGAAGVVGVIKTVLALQNGEIPPSLNFRQPNPHINWEEIPVVVPTNITPWQAHGGRLIAGVSAFGFGGTNVHVVLEQAPEQKMQHGERAVELIRPGTEPERPLHLFTLSAKNENSLMELARRYVSHLTNNPSMPLEDVCFTVNAGRSHFDHRLATAVASSEQLIERLRAFATQNSSDEVICGRVDDAEEPKIAFLFTGHGSQHVGMGKQMYETQPTFRKALERCEELLRPYLETPLLSVLYPKPNEESPLGTPSYAQPALFALEYALAELWRSWGIEPAVVMGHGIGEYVAAHVAEAMSLKDALKLVAERGRMFETLTNEEAMAVLSTEDREFVAMVRVAEKECVGAPLGGPKNTLISGGNEPDGSVYVPLEAEGINSNRPPSSHPFPSSVREQTLNAFYEKAREISFSRIQIPLVSCVLGMSVKDELTKPEYWRDHIHLPARFSDAMQALYKQGCRIFIEVSPNPVFLQLGNQMLQKPQAVWLPTLMRGGNDWQSMLSSLSRLYVNGMSVDWSGFDRDYQRKKTVLPTYPFNKKKYWTEDRRHVTFVKLEKRQENAHPILGSRMHSPLFQDAVFGVHYSENNPSFILDHRIHGRCLMPGAGYLAMAIVAAEEVFDQGTHAVEQLLFHKPMVFEEGQSRHVQFVLSPEENEAASFKVFSLASNAKGPKKEWTHHASGVIRIGDGRSPKISEVFDQAEAQARCERQVDVRSHFMGMEKVGAELGPCFQGIEKLCHGKNESLARLVLPEELLSEADEYAIHPAILDAAIQVMGSVLMSEQAYASAYLPIEVERYCVYRSIGNAVWCRAVIHESIDQDAQALAGDIELYDESGRLSATLEGVQLKRTDPEALQRVIDKGFSDWLYELVWRPMDGENVAEGSIDRQSGAWLIFAGPDTTSEDFKGIIEEYGGTTIIVTDGPGFERRKNNYTVNCKQPEDYQKLFRDLNQRLHGVVFLWSAASSESSKMSARELENRMEKTCGSVLHLVQAMINTNEATPPKLWIVTRGAAGIESRGPHPVVVEGALWGLGRAIAMEHPELFCARVDLDIVESGEQVKALFHEVWFPSGEDQIAFRYDKRYVARMVSHESVLKVQGDNLYLSGHSQVRSDRLRDDASYLITGGLGSLGLQVARWMVQKGALHLVLMGRSGPSQEALEVIVGLEQAGAKILVFRGDVTREDDVARIMDELRASMPPLNGVIHAAGILDDALLLKEEWKHFSSVLAPKVSGAWNLHIATEQLPLDFFILFSSTAALLPTHGQCSYATANAFLDSLAHFRHAKGLPSLSINWGVWIGGGMAASVGDRERQSWSQQGVTLMQPVDALKALDQVLTEAVSQVAIIPVDWSTFFHFQKDPQVPTMLKELASKNIKTSKIVTSAPEEPDLRQRLNETVPNQRLGVLSKYVIEAAAKILKLDDANTLSAKKPLREAGLDSLMAVELRDALSLAVRRNLPATLLFKYSTIEALTEYLATEILSIDAPIEEATSSQNVDEIQQDFDDLKSLSDEEISRLLAEELKSLPEELRNK